MPPSAFDSTCYGALTHTLRWDGMGCAGNNNNDKCISGGLMHVAAWHHRTPESKFTKFGEEMFIGQTPNHAKFCGDSTKIVRDIRNRKFVLPKIGPKFTKIA